MRIVIEVKKDANAQVVLNTLYKHTQLQISFGAIMLALVDGVPKILNLKEILTHYLNFQKDVIVRRTKYDLDKAEQKAHILQGLVIAQANIDEVIRTIKLSDDKNTEMELIKNLFHRIFIKDENVINQEDISLYKNDFTQLYVPSQSVKNKEYDSPAFEKEMNSCKINLLITGSISSYGDFISVSLDLYLYPGCKKIASLMEVGTLKEIDLLTTSLVGQMIPFFTNAMPVKIKLEITPEAAMENTRFFIDDVLQVSNEESITLEAGQHNFEFTCEGYKTISTNYIFEGNRNYKIQVN